MNDINRQIFVTKKGFQNPINIVEGTDLIPITVTILDYAIPAGSAATAYNIQPSGTLVKQLCSISANSVTFTPPSGFYLEGYNRTQIRVTNNEHDLFCFEINVWTDKNIASGDDAEEINNNPTLLAQVLSKYGEVSENILTINQQITSLDSQVDAADKQISNLNTETSVIKAQIAEMQKIPEGGTTADAALNDIKIGYDGTEYATPGEAVRGQVGSLSEELESVKGISSEITKDENKYYIYSFTNATGLLKKDGTTVFDVQQTIHTNKIQTENIVKIETLLLKNWITNYPAFIFFDKNGMVIETSSGESGENVNEYTLYSISKKDFPDSAKYVAVNASTTQNELCYVIKNKCSILIYGDNFTEIDDENTSEKSTYSSQKINEIIKNSDVNKWEGKNICFEGDSITANVTIGYPSYVCEKLGANCIKIAIPGVPVMGNYPAKEYDFRTRIQNIPYNADAIVILGDTNAIDIAGSEGDYFSTDENKWSGRWNLALDAIKKSFPTVPLFLVSCFRQAGKDAQAKYVPDMFRRFANYHGCIFIDLTTESSLNLQYSSKIWGLSSVDGVHPNHTVMPMYADVILEHIKKINPSNFSDVDSISLDKNDLELSIGETYEIIPTLSGNLSVQWTSNNNDIASVIGGTVYAKSLGKCIITAKTRCGNTASCNVTINS